MITVVRIDPADPALRLLTPFVATRVETYAAAHQPELDPATLARTVVSRLWAGDPHVLVLGLVGDRGDLVGHVLAEALGVGPTRRVVIGQVQADGNVGPARVQAVHRAIEWARSLGTDRVFLTTHRDPQDWTPLGFQRHRYVLQWEGARDGDLGNGDHGRRDPGRDGDGSDQPPAPGRRRG